MEKFDAQQYRAEVNARMPKGCVFRACIRAFWTGGVICCIGQLTNDALRLLCKLPKEETAAGTAIIMVFLGAFLTGIGVYDKIGDYAGAGSVVPITGFANSVVSPAMEFKPEGYVLGVGAKMFGIAGPVLVYGITASVIAGLLSLLIGGGA